MRRRIDSVCFLVLETVVILFPTSFVIALKKLDAEFFLHKLSDADKAMSDLLPFSVVLCYLLMWVNLHKF